MPARTASRSGRRQARGFSRNTWVRIRRGRQPLFRGQRVLRCTRQLPKPARGRMPRTSKEKPAGAMDGPAGVKWRGQEPNKRGFTRAIAGSRPAATQNATQFRPIASSCSPARWSSWRAWGFPRRRGLFSWGDLLSPNRQLCREGFRALPHRPRVTRRTRAEVPLDGLSIRSRAPQARQQKSGRRDKLGPSV